MGSVFFSFVLVLPILHFRCRLACGLMGCSLLSHALFNDGLDCRPSFLE